MRKTTRYILILCLLFLLPGCGNPKDRQQGGDTVEAYTPLPETEGLLREDEVFDLGSHMVAYHVLREDIDTAYTFHGYETFQGTDYIAIHDLDNGSVWYLPDVYGKILEINVQEPVGVSLRYIPEGCEDIREVCIPVYFYERDNGKVMDFDPYVHKEKSIFGAQEGLEAGSDALPHEVWEETFCMGEKEYTVLFERITPIYNPGYESGEVQADYCLSVRDGGENVLSRQMIVHYPVAYEDTHWLIDFSGDGFSDIAFCTDLFRGGKYGSWSVSKLLIWNADAGCYEEERINGARNFNLPMWNMDTASLVTCADTRSDSEIYWSKEMYAWMDGEWQRTRRFERVYSESEFLDMPGEGEKYPYADGYRELVYSEGEWVEENRIEKDFYENDAFWFEESCIWSDNYKNGIKLYPDWPEWEQVKTEVGGIILHKYVKAVSETD